MGGVAGEDEGIRVFGDRRQPRKKQFLRSPPEGLNAELSLGRQAILDVTIREPNELHSRGPPVEIGFEYIRSEVLSGNP